MVCLFVVGYREFVRVMNEVAERLKLRRTRFCNPHGLSSSSGNRSTSEDMCILLSHAMRNRLFREVVSCSKFTADVKNTSKGSVRRCSWENTNKLLDIASCLGGKTGVTPTAGPCLATLFRVNSFRTFAIVLLNSPSLEERFTETLAIFDALVDAVTGRRSLSIW